MIRRLRLAPALLALGLVTPGSAAAATIDFGGPLGLAYEPKETTIAPGESVTWRGDFGDHPLYPDDPNAFAPRTTGTGEYTVRFDRAGTYTYYCLTHSYVPMAGQITVAVPTSTTGPSGPSGPTGPSGPSGPTPTTTTTGGGGAAPSPPPPPVDEGPQAPAGPAGPAGVSAVRRPVAPAPPATLPPRLTAEAAASVKALVRSGLTVRVAPRQDARVSATLRLGATTVAAAPTTLVRVARPRSLRLRVLPAAGPRLRALRTPRPARLTVTSTARGATPLVITRRLVLRPK